MNCSEIMQKLRGIFFDYFQEMHKEESVFAESGRERLRMEIYRPSDAARFPIKKAAFMILDYGLVWNKDDKTVLDEDELVAGSLITGDDLPLPILALEASMHYDKYDHMNIDLFPVSNDQRYREIFCKPVQDICHKYKSLPGVAPGVITPNLPEGATSGGMMSGNFDIGYRAETFPWWFEYVTLYRHFLDNRERYPILKDPAIVADGRKIRDQFLTNFRMSTPKILSDIPHLNTEERGKRLGELIF
jgi:hypothetical protein